MSWHQGTDLVVALLITGALTGTLVDRGRRREPAEKAIAFGLVFLGLAALADLAAVVVPALGDPLDFGTRCVAGTAAFFLALSLRHLLDRSKPAHDRLRYLWVAFFATALTFAVAVTSFAGSARARFPDRIGLTDLVLALAALLAMGSLAQQLTQAVLTQNGKEKR